MAQLNFNIEDICGTLSENKDGWRKELTYISWNNRAPKFDLRSWDPDYQAMTKGITMTKEELEHNLGTIAQSGSLAFKQENQTDDTDIIGQFGVGFYASFMVASHVKVVSKACGSEQAYIWESDGADGYTIEPG